MGPNMPVSVACESAADKCVAAIRGSLSLTSTSDGSLSHGQKLDESLLANAKRALLSDIEYEHTPDSSHNTVIDKLKSKYTVLNGNVPPPTTNNSGSKHIASGKYHLYCYVTVYNIVSLLSVSFVVFSVRSKRNGEVNCLKR